MFNVLFDPWLSVISTKGVSKRICLMDALTGAGTIQIAYPNPMDKLAAFRFILALLYWCKEHTHDDLSEDIPPSWITFLSKNKDLFNLFGTGARFYQEANLNRTRPITELFHEVPTGNNAWHFHHVRDYGTGVCCSCCVTGMLRLPLFSVSGLPDLKSGINGSPPTYVLYWGTNLFSAVKYNWHPQENMGDPIWVAPYGYTQDDEVPLLPGLTVPARKLYLEYPHDSEEPCIVCGEKPGRLVTFCQFESAGSLENSTWHDPHTIFSGERLVRPENIMLTGKLVKDMKYRELLPQFLKNHQSTSPRQILIIGFSTKEAKYVDIWERTMVIDHLQLNSEKLEVISKWNDFVYNTPIHPKGKNERQESLRKSLFNDLLPNVENKLLPKLTQLMNSDNPDWNKAGDLYRPSLKISASALYPNPLDVDRKSVV